MTIEQAKGFLKTLGMEYRSESEEEKDNCINIFSRPQSYTLEEVKLSMKSESIDETLVKSVVVCHVEDEAKVLFELWKQHTTKEEHFPMHGLPRLISQPFDFNKNYAFKQPKQMLFISRQRSKSQLLGDAIAQLLVPKRHCYAPLTYLVSKYPQGGCENVATLCRMFSSIVKDIADENIFIDDTVKDYRNEKAVLFVMNTNIDLIFVDKFVWSDDKK